VNRARPPVLSSVEGPRPPLCDRRVFVALFLGKATNHGAGFFGRMIYSRIIFSKPWIPNSHHSADNHFASLFISGIGFYGGRVFNAWNFWAIFFQASEETIQRYWLLA
jgi:hypothetical protein